MSTQVQIPEGKIILESLCSNWNYFGKTPSGPSQLLAENYHDTQANNLLQLSSKTMC